MGEFGEYPNIHVSSYIDITDFPQSGLKRVRFRKDKRKEGISFN